MAPVQHNNVKYTLASHAVEYLRPSEDAIDLMQKISNEKISADEAVAELLRKYDLTQEANSLTHEIPCNVPPGVV